MREGWQTVYLGDVCTIVGGGTPPKDHPDYYAGDIPWATVRDMRWDIIDDTEFHITEEAVKQSSTHIIPAGNVVIATRVGLGKTCLLAQDTAINQDLRGVIPTDLNVLSIRFLFCWFQTVANTIIDHGTGATVQGVRLPFIKTLSLPLPPLSEQQRIVRILDEAFEGIATAKANAERNLANAKALFESYQEAALWLGSVDSKNTTLEDQIDLLAGFAFKSAGYTQSKDSVRLLGGDNILQGALRWQGVRKWPISEASAYDAYRLGAGDVVLAMDRPWIKAGLKRAHLQEADLPCLLLQRTARLRAGNTIHDRYLFYLVSSTAFSNHLIDAQTGIGVPHVSGKQISSFRFSMPPLGLQQRIANQLDLTATETQRLAHLYTRKLAALDELKQSLLHQAFAGEL
jgi:type I restriction enzyme S subunit